MPSRILAVLLLAVAIIAACGPTGVRHSLGSTPAVGSAAAKSSAHPAGKPRQWHLVPLPVSGRAAQGLALVSQLHLAPGPDGSVLFSGSPALCYLVAGTVIPDTGVVHLLSNATYGHSCGLMPAGAALFAGDQLSGTSCGQIFYRTVGAWKPVKPLGMLCAPPPPAPRPTLVRRGAVAGLDGGRHGRGQYRPMGLPGGCESGLVPGPCHGRRQSCDRAAPWPLRRHGRSGGGCGCRHPPEHRLDSEHHGERPGAAGRNLPGPWKPVGRHVRMVPGLSGGRSVRESVVSERLRHNRDAPVPLATRHRCGACMDCRQALQRELFVGADRYRGVVRGAAPAG